MTSFKNYVYLPDSVAHYPGTLFHRTSTDNASINVQPSAILNADPFAIPVGSISNRKRGLRPRYVRLMRSTGSGSTQRVFHKTLIVLNPLDFITFSGTPSPVVTIAGVDWTVTDIVKEAYFAAVNV
jgi:hypothetical protein